MAYTAPVSEFKFLLDQVVGYAAVAATDRFAEAGPETVAAVLNEAGRLASEVLAPLHRVGDAMPARLEAGEVRMPAGFREAYQVLADGGWVGLTARPSSGGMGLPQTLNTCVNEMFSAGCLSLWIAPMLTQGQIEALEAHADPERRALYLPRLVSGAWTGTMNLTEPQAGSDVGAVQCRAEPARDGAWQLTGQKIYISYADHDLAENVCHLVLARRPGAPAGTRGLSLFLVPKFLPDADGRLRERNAVRILGLESKLGQHAAPTATVAFDGATGWLVGPPEGGMSAMFTMMNNARLGVATHGTSIAERAWQAARRHAAERVQGGGPLARHPDVQRMLAGMAADLFAARALSLFCGVAIDLADATGSAGWQARAALLTPLAKAFCTETGVAAADTAIQVFGGMGYIEETGIAQLWRDARVAPIYEGTNGIQAMDLVGRKLADGGVAALALIEEIEADAGLGPATLGEPVSRAAQVAAAATRSLVAAERTDRQAGAAAYLRALALLVGAQAHLRSARSEPADGPRRALAEIYVSRRLPDLHARLSEATRGGSDLADWATATFA